MRKLNKSRKMKNGKIEIKVTKVFTDFLDENENV